MAIGVCACACLGVGESLELVGVLCIDAFLCTCCVASVDLMLVGLVAFARAYALEVHCGC